MVRNLYDRQITTRYADFVSKMVRKPTKPAHVSLEAFKHYKKMRSTPEYKAKSEQASRNRRSEVGGPGSGSSVHGGGAISIYEHSLRLEKKLGRKPTTLDLCLYLHTRDHDGITFLDLRAEAIAAAIHERTRDLSQLQPDTPIDETELYLEIVQRNDKGRRFGIGWTPSGSKMRRHDEAGSSRPIFADDEPFDQFKKEFKEMQTMILKMVNDTSVNRDQLLEMQGRLHRMEEGFMERSAAQKRQDDVDDDDAAHNDSTTEDDE
ncbi:hypothetical protein Sjap_022086 [Stephania japonica]|uniref:Uncharacterized protein n=1 Tax=Stephania japonica TaxID=461633 RepID=A0AAP0ENM4_9MAGN